MSRTDDVINVAAHRLSTSEMEEVLNGHTNIAESAVVGMNDVIKGEIPVGFVVLKTGATIDAQKLEQECASLIRSQIGAIACYKMTIIVQRLPKTRSGKILRNVLRRMCNGSPYSAPATIDDPVVLDEVQKVVHSRGLPVKL